MLPLTWNAKLDSSLPFRNLPRAYLLHLGAETDIWDAEKFVFHGSSLKISMLTKLNWSGRQRKPSKWSHEKQSVESEFARSPVQLLDNWGCQFQLSFSRLPLVTTQEKTLSAQKRVDAENGFYRTPDLKKSLCNKNKRENVVSQWMKSVWDVSRTWLFRGEPSVVASSSWPSAEHERCPPEDCFAGGDQQAKMLSSHQNRSKKHPRHHERAKSCPGNKFSAFAKSWPFCPAFPKSSSMTLVQSVGWCTLFSRWINARKLVKTCHVLQRTLPPEVEPRLLFWQQAPQSSGFELPTIINSSTPKSWFCTLCDDVNRIGVLLRVSGCYCKEFVSLLWQWTKLHFIEFHLTKETVG